MMCFTRIALILLISAVFQPVIGFAKESAFRAFVDKTQIGAGETIRLNLELAGQAKQDPDFSVLDQDFTIISRESGSSSTFINGNFSVKSTWVLELFPKKSSKNITIPSIKLGSHSTLPIDIIQSDEKPANEKTDVTLQVTTDKKEAYINAEIILNLEIKTALSLRNGTLSKPEIKNAIVEPLTEDDQKVVIEDGIKYQIYRKSYAIFPTKAGKLVIPPISFGGIVVGSRARRHPWSNFFSSGTRVNSRSQQIEINVKDIPKEYPKGHPFLPLKSFVIIEAFDEPEPKFEINKAITRHFEMKAKGTLPSFLPNIAPPDVDNLQIYTEASQKIQKSVEDGMESSTKFSHVYMPTAPGKIAIPEQVIYWWDTDSEKVKSTAIRSLQLDVFGPPPSAIKPMKEDLSPPVDNSPIAKEAVEKNSLWIMAGVLIAILWLITIVVIGIRWRMRNRISQSKEDMPLSEQFRILVREIVMACDKKDEKEVYRTARKLVSWIRMNPHSAQPDQELWSQIEQLEAALFDQRKKQDIEVLLLDIRRGVNRLRLIKTNELKLSPLYPS